MTKLFHSRLILPLIGVLLILFGLSYAIRSGRRAVDAYRAMQFAGEHDFDAGDPDVELISHWMNIRYIAEAYAVPQSYIFDEIGVEMTRPASELPLGRLNQRNDFGQNELGEPMLVDLVADVVLAYRENPVVTGLSEGGVRHWMNVTYIANSTGIPVEIFFNDLGIPAEGHAYMPLERLVEESGYASGIDQLIKTLEQTLEANGGTP